MLNVISAIRFLHNKNILHNDIKSDNIVVDECGPKAVLIDFGKACFIKEAVKYFLSPEEKSRYKKEHPHIAPDLRDGHCNQSKSTDIFSFGRVY